MQNRLPPSHTHENRSFWPQCEQWLGLDRGRTCEFKSQTLCHCGQNQLTFEQCEMHTEAPMAAGPKGKIRIVDDLLLLLRAKSFRVESLRIWEEGRAFV